MNRLIIISASALLSFLVHANPDCVDCDIQTKLEGSVPTLKRDQSTQTTSSSFE